MTIAMLFLEVTLKMTDPGLVFKSTVRVSEPRVESTRPSLRSAAAKRPGNTCRPSTSLRKVFAEPVRFPRLTLIPLEFKVLKSDLKACR